ncbi:SCO family protein [Methylobacterium sp. J-067]|uniref:SCO family protein n=1 Tax=Methylobacterium sp. J-067 TaxID=2836648 RepID=UPI001FBC1488|nr:SCO family protein [Methylobacterium sp. J-067]MCJ2024143.1 SCO family protein [Methylobacterium sp. J-067]
MKIIALATALTLAGIGLLTGRATAETGPSDLGNLVWRGGATSRRDVQGRDISPGDLRDRLTVVSFASAGCTILCVTRTMDLDRLARDLPASLRDRVRFLVIGTDPAADDDARLRAFADGLLGPDRRLRFLASDAAETKALAEQLRYPADRLPEPPPTVLLFDRRGNLAMTYGGDPLDAPRLNRDLATLNTFTQGVGQPATPSSH